MTSNRSTSGTLTKQLLNAIPTPIPNIASSKKFSTFTKINITMWETIDDQLSRTFKFNSFVEAFAFMTKIALTAEKLDHHPTLINTYNEVTIRLGTHEAGGEVTDKDHFLAAAIDNIYGD